MNLIGMLFCLVVGIPEMCNDGQGPKLACYADALRICGHAPVIVCRSDDKKALGRVVDALDAMVFAGGEDIHPGRYGSPVSPVCGKINAVRDDFEISLLEMCVQRRKPVLGICRGCQLLNVYFGGTLYQDIATERGADASVHRQGSYLNNPTNMPAHEIVPVSGTRLEKVVGGEAFAVNSFHHQCVRKLAPSFVVSARAPDGVVEAIEHKSYPAVGLQFHPEHTITYGPHSGYDLGRHKRIFSCLGELLSGKGL